MIRGRKEGNTYASWFIGFDHDDTFGLPTFPELPTQSARTSGSSKPVSRATSLESLLSLGQLRDFPISVRSLTPAATQTSGQLSAQTQTTQEIQSKTSHQVFAQTSTQTTEEILSKTPHQVSTQTSIQTTEGISIKTPHQISTQTAAQITKEIPDKPPHQISTQTVSSESSTELACRSRTPVQGETKSHFDTDRSRRRWEKDAQGLYKEAFDGAKRAEEFKFRVKFDKLVGDLHLSIEEKSPNGLTASFASPSYGEVMLTFKEKVKEQIQIFTQRLQLAYESLGPVDTSENIGQKVKQNVSKFIEDLIGETLDLTSDEAVSDLSSLSGDSTPDQNLFDDLIAQAVVSKLLENFYKEANETLHSSNNNLKKVYLREQGTETQDNLKKVNCRKQGTETEDILKKVNLKEQGTETQDNLNKVDLREQGTETQGNLNKVDLREQGTETEDILKKVNLKEQGTETQDNLKKVNFREQGIETEDNLKKIDLREQETDTQDNLKKVDLREQGTATQDIVIVRNQKDNFRNYEFDETVDIVDGNGKHSEKYLNDKNISRLDIINKGSGLISVDTEEEPEIRRYQSVTKEVNYENGIIRTANITDGKSNSSYEIAEANGQNNVKVENDTSDEKTDFIKEFEQLKEFVKKTSVRPKVEAIPFDDSNLCEVKEEALLKTKVNRDEEREEFHTRYSVFDRVYNFQPVLPDFSQFENIDFNSDETDPDLLSMNLEIIPEETEEELEEEEDEQGKWNANWLFKGKGASPYANVGKKTVSRDAEGSLYMTVPRPDDRYAPRIGNRDIDQLSDISDYDLLGRTDFDGSDEEENTFYANTSKELARISGHHRWSDDQKRLSSRSNFEDSNINNRHEVEKINERNTLAADFKNIVNSTGHIPGPIIEPSGLLQDLSPAEDDDPKFLSPPESVVVQEGEPVKFSCRVSGTGTVDVFWYREGSEIEELEESEDVEISVNGDKHSIVLYNIGKKLAGQYMCIVMNEQQSKAIQYLTVTVKDSKQELKQPVFLKGLKDVEVTEGQSVKLRVKVKGYPPPRISWYKDGELLKRSKLYRIEKFGNRDYILTIDYASMNDDAEYTVSARNVAGEARMSTQVIVEPQTDLPARGQRISSTSDSDSDRSTSHRSLTLGVGSAGFTTSSNKQDLHHINYLDRRLTFTQKQVERGNQNILDTIEKEQSSGRQRLITANTKDVLQIAEELIQHERNVSPLVPNQMTNGEMTSTVSSPHISNPDNFLEDLLLPDKLDEFILPEQNSKNSGVMKSTSELLFTGASQHDNAESCYRGGTAPEKSEVSIQKQAVTLSESVVSMHDSAPVEINTNVSTDRLLNDAAVSYISHSCNVNSTDLDQIHLEISRQQDLRDKYSRDFEVNQNKEETKWSVTLDPFSPQAEVNRQNSVDRTLERGDNSSQSSSRRQSIDSGVSVCSKQKQAAPVHMVGHTTEDEVPESRTEFNTDGSIELPSVNRLRAMFSSVSDDEMGGTSLKRIHSITARNVPKEQLEKLRASNQNEPSSGKFLNVPGPSKEISQISLQQINNDVLETLSSSSLTSPLNLKQVTVSKDPVSVNNQKMLHIPVTGAYRDLNPDKDPVLIYPETHPEYMQRHHPQQKPSSREPSSAQHQWQTVTKSSSAASPKPTQPHHSKLILRQVMPDSECDNVQRSGPRIKSGCISARAAFWERKIVDNGTVNDEEFPEMVEDNSI